LKYKALGDVLISLTFGPLLVGFAFLAQTGGLDARPLVASLPLAMHIEAILHANNARDVKDDLARGVKTLASILGEKMSSHFYKILVGLPFVGLAARAYSESSLTALLPILSSPLAFKLIRAYQQGNMADLPKDTAKFQFAFGLLLVGSLLL